jgi:hypothetical protein
MGLYNYNKKLCINCKKLISLDALRCGSCSKVGKNNPMFNKKHTRNTKKLMKEKSIGENNSAYIDGHWIKKNYCKDCHKKISPNSIRCEKCENKTRIGIKNPEHSLRMKGKNHPNFSHGKTLVRISCLDCKKLLSKKAYYYGYKRCNSCAKKFEFQNPERNPSYIDGRTFESYPRIFNKNLKEKIRKRDNYTCQCCKIKQKQYKRKLDIHHIDYNKKNCSIQNLIAVCNHCNILANYNIY